LCCSALFYAAPSARRHIQSIATDPHLKTPYIKSPTHHKRTTHKTGAGGPAAQIPWYDHAKFEYYAPIRALFGVQMLLFAWVEMRRLQDIRNPGSAGQDPIFSQYRCACVCVVFGL